MADMLGYGPGEIIGRKVESFMYPEDLEEHNERMKEREEGQHGFYERRFRKKNGTALWALVSSTPLIDPGGDLNGSFGMITDITERKAAEEKIRLSLLEKETLLKEIHHRVKNNFQLVVSLLNLQSQKVEDAGLKEQFADAQNRIRAMALVHEKLYGAENFGSVNIADYVRDISGALSAGVPGIKRLPSIRLDLGDVYVGIDHAIPCGLIINELITNAFKHAFEGEAAERPEITVSLTGGRGSVIELSVGDNGKGLPEEFDFDGNRSLGLYLVNLLAKQIGGTISLEREGGTRFILRFTA
jgi:PAS domain S-box-containing protein